MGAIAMMPAIAQFMGMYSAVNSQRMANSQAFEGEMAALENQGYQDAISGEITKMAVAQASRMAKNIDQLSQIG